MVGRGDSEWGGRLCGRRWPLCRSRCAAARGCHEAAGCYAASRCYFGAHGDSVGPHRGRAAGPEGALMTWTGCGSRSALVRQTGCPAACTPRRLLPACVSRRLERHGSRGRARVAGAGAAGRSGWARARKRRRRVWPLQVLAPRAADQGAGRRLGAGAAAGRVLRADGGAGAARTRRPCRTLLYSGRGRQTCTQRLTRGASPHSEATASQQPRPRRSRFGLPLRRTRQPRCAPRCAARCASKAAPLLGGAASHALRRAGWRVPCVLPVRPDGAAV